MPIRQHFLRCLALIVRLFYLGRLIDPHRGGPCLCTGRSILGAPRHRVHQLHHIANRLGVEHILQIFHLRHLLQHLAEVFTLFYVEEHVHVLDFFSAKFAFIKSLITQFMFGLGLQTTAI